MVKGQPEVFTCPLCGNMIVQPIIHYRNEKCDTNPLYLCPQCAQTSGTCNFCMYKNTCRFETDSNIKEEKYINRVIKNQQGQPVMNQQIKNPERMKKTCADGCNCYHDEQCCKTQEMNYWCKNFQE